MGRPLLEQLDGAPMHLERAEEIGYFDIPECTEERIPALRPAPKKTMTPLIETPPSLIKPAKSVKPRSPKPQDEFRTLPADERDMSIQYGREGRSMTLFFKAMGRYPLLTREEEIELGKKVAEGTPEEKAAAIERLVNCNLRFVVWVAKQYRNRGLEFMDLIQEGTIGCHKAAEKFDYNRNVRFTSYAFWWIRAFIKEAIIDKGRTICIPSKQMELVKHLISKERELALELGRKPTHEELAQALGVKPKLVLNLLLLLQKPLSLDAMPGDGENTTLEQFIPDERAEQTFERIEFVEGSTIIKRIPFLSKREFGVICRRFGFSFSSEDSGGESMTLEEIGKEMGLCRERIRQFESRALQKMRRHLKNKEF